MINSEIISAADVMDALTSGFEVLMIDKDKTNRFGASCIPLTGQTFTNIEKFVDEGDNANRIYVKTEKYVKNSEEEVEDEE